MDNYLNSEWREKHLLNEGWCLGSIACDSIWWCSFPGVLRVTAIFTCAWLLYYYFLAYTVYPMLSFIDRRYPSKYDNEKGRFWMAWHLQSTTHSILVVAMVIGPMWRTSLSEDAQLVRFANVSDIIPRSILRDMYQLGNVPSIFWTFLAADMIITSAHRIGGWDNIVHHCIFILFCLVVTYGCFASYLAGAMMLMEVSTICLNYFSFFRNRTGFGSDSVSVLLSFLLFALSFVVFRLVFFTRVALDFVLSVYEGTIYAVIPLQLLVLICIGLVAACALQFYWAVIIFQKALRQGAPQLADKLLGKKSAVKEHAQDLTEPLNPSTAED